MKFGAPRDTEHPELRQPLAMEIWESILQTLEPGSKITVLTNGPLTNLAKVVSVKNISSRIQVSSPSIQKVHFVSKELKMVKLVVIRHNRSKMFQEVYVVGGHISKGGNDKGNLFSIPSNKYAEFNMFLDPIAAKTVFESEVNITLVPLGIQRKASSFPSTLNLFRRTQITPEAVFSKRLLLRLLRLKKSHNRYQHMVNVHNTP